VIAGNVALGCVVTAIVTLSAFKTIGRNKDWKNDFTLYSKDIYTVPNSLLVNANLGVAYIDMADLQKSKQAKDSMMLKGIPLLNKAIMLQNTCIPAYINKGVAYFRMENPDSAKAAYDQVARLYPGYPPLPELLYNTGVMFFKNRRAPEAAACWQTTLKLNPNYQDAQKGLNVLYDIGYRPAP
jgi:tetratricopeptide (TPR) repeat protein